MNKTDNDELLKQRLNAMISYSAYLKLIKRCGVLAMPVHGWVSE